MCCIGRKKWCPPQECGCLCNIKCLLCLSTLAIPRLLPFLQQYMHFNSCLWSSVIYVWHHSHVVGIQLFVWWYLLQARPWFFRRKLKNVLVFMLECWTMTTPPRMYSTITFSRTGERLVIFPWFSTLYSCYW